MLVKLEVTVYKMLFKVTTTLQLSLLCPLTIFRSDPGLNMYRYEQ